jgi:hypothetical protein
MMGSRLPATPAYLERFVPAAIATGIGIGLVMPSLTGAAVHGLPDDRFGLGSGVNQAFRQVAAALGVAITIALLQSTRGPAAFTHVFSVVWMGGLATALLGARIDTRPGVGVSSTEEPVNGRGSRRFAWALTCK